jgi:putative NIF3 family GTP cyclohydrolase 1 type 2
MRFCLKIGGFFVAIFINLQPKGVDKMNSQEESTVTVSSVLNVLNEISKGRMVKDWKEIVEGKNPYVVMKNSNIPGKSVMEIPGIIFGDTDKPVKKVGVCMTMTECVIELASAMELDLLIAHHPVADAASAGGVPLAHYLPLYNLAVIEMHEAFHGLHPGIAYLHGHEKLMVDANFGGIPGNVLIQGKALKGIHTAGDIFRHLGRHMGAQKEEELLAYERMIRDSPSLMEATTANPAQLLHGQADSPVQNILHIFPHTGFQVEHLHSGLEMYPETDTIIASISRVKADHPLVCEAKTLGLTFIVGNTHALEMWENGVPLAYALESMLPGMEVYLVRERATATLLREAAHPEIQEYGMDMSRRFLVPKITQTQGV